MFLDERINAEQGRAFRLTVIFAWAVSVLYGVFHFALLKIAGNVPISSLSVEIFCGIGGAVLIGIGELKKWGEAKDEMWQYEKNKYYSKAFYIFLYILLFAYCCIRVPAYIVLSPYDMPPNQLLVLLELTGFIVLITRFKLSEVPFNYTFISEEKRSYGMAVLVNVGKLGGMILLFTSLSFIPLVFMGGGAIELLSVLLSGLFTFFSMGFQYVLFSVSEWLSDRAKEKKVISLSTLFFFFAAALFAIGGGVLGVYCSVDHGHNIVTGAHAVLLSSLMRYFALMQTALFAVFAAYLFSEVRVLRVEKLSRAVKLFAVATVMEITVSELVRVATTAVMSAENESIRSVYTIIGFTNQALSFGFTVLTAAAIYLGARALVEKGLASKLVIAVPVLKLIQSLAFFIWSIVFQSWAATIGDYLAIFFFTGVYIVWVILGARDLKKRALSVADEKESE